MAFVQFRARWVRNGVVHVKGDVLEVSDDLADLLVDQHKAARIADPAPMEPSEAEPLDAAMAESAEQVPEEPAPAYKSGSVRKTK